MVLRQDVLTLSPDLSETAHVRAFIRALLADLGLSQERAFDIQLAVSEATANACEHAGARGRLRVEAKVFSDRLEVFVHGPGEFQVTSRRDDREHRGLGLPLMATLSDRLALYTASEGGTVVALTFFLHPRTRSASALQPPLGKFSAETMLRSQGSDDLPSGFYVLDGDWRFLYVSSTVVESLPVSAEELLGRVIWDTFPDYEGEARRALEEGKEAGSPVRVVAHSPAGDASREWSAFPVGEGMAVFSRDIGDERLVAEEMNRFFTLSPGILAIVSMVDGRWDRVNRAFTETLGWSEREAAAMVVTDIIHPDDLSHSQAVTERLAEGAPILHLEHRLRSKKGDYRWIAWDIHTGRREGVLYWAGRDITERVRTEQEHEKLVTEMPAGFALHELIVGEDGRPADYRFLDVNPAFERLTGLRATDIIGRTALEVLPGLEPFWIETYGRVALEGEEANFEHHSASLGRDYEVVAYSPAPGRFATLFNDVTVRKRASAEIEREREVLRASMESTHAQVAYLDSDFNFVLVNSAYEEGSGHSSAELVGRNHFDFYPDEDNERIFREVRDTGVARSFRARPFTHSGQPRQATTYWDWTITPVEGRAARSVGLVLSLVDVTDATRARHFADALAGLNAVLGSSLEVDRILSDVLTQAARVVGADAALLMLMGADAPAIEYAAGSGLRLLGAQVADAYEDLARRSGGGELVRSGDFGRNGPLVSFLLEPLNINDLAWARLDLGPERGGFLLLGAEQETAFGPATVDFAEKLATSMSLALANARLYEAQKSISDTLQESLIRQPASIAGLDLDFLYRSASDAAMIGGDFFDVFPVDGGRVGLLIGDVCGHGVDAAAVAGLMRATLRAYALQGLAPYEVLDLGNKAMGREAGMVGFTTVFFAVLQCSSGHLAYASAGHPPPIVRRLDGRAESLPARFGLPIGIVEEAKYEQCEAELRAGELLLLFTDGVIEARHGTALFGEGGLASALESDCGEIEGLSARMVEAVLGFSDGHLRDDVALLAVSRRPPPSQSTRPDTGTNA